MRSTWWWRAPGLVTIAALATLALAALAAVAVLTAWGQRLDDLGLAFGIGQTWAEDMGLGLWRRQIALPLSLAVMVASGVWLLVQRRWRTAIVVAGAVVLANLLTQLIKGQLDRPEHGFPPDPNSFPSGHVAFVGAAGYALTLAVPLRARPVAALVAIGATAFTGWSSMLGAHRPSDCIAAALVLLVVGALGLAVLRVLPAEEDGVAGRGSWSFVVLAVAALLGGLAVVGTALVATGMTDLFRGLEELVAATAGMQAFLAACGVLFAVTDLGSRPALREDASRSR